MSSFYLECYTGLKWFKENIQYQFESTKVFLSKFLSKDFCYKMRQFFYKIRQLLQISTILLQNATAITKCDVYYKLRQKMEQIHRRTNMQKCDY